MSQTTSRPAPEDEPTAAGPRVLYLVHDLDDAAVWRRAAMFRLGGARVDLVGFRRQSGLLPGDARVLGQTRNARMAERALSVLRQRLRPGPGLAEADRPDVIVARNLEMLALAVPLRRRLASGDHVPLVYEVLDIHRLLVGGSAAARGLRRIERSLCRDVDHLLVSSPAFLREHFEVHWNNLPPTTLVENKVFLPEPLTPRARRPAAPAGPLRIGWFGILRCRVSLDCLDAMTRADPGHYEISLRGRPALDELPDFHERVAANPDLRFGGAYDYPNDLARIYGEVDLAWLVDRYDAGRNSDWLLPNRLYESGLNGVPPIGLEGTEVASKMNELGIGVTLSEATAEAARVALSPLTPNRLDTLQTRQASVPNSTWATSEAECRDLVERITYSAPETEPDLPDLTEDGVLVVVPTLNEARHIRGVLESQLPFLRRRAATAVPARLVVADGGSTDGTQDIVREVAQGAPDLDIRLMDNPRRLQSAGVNLACTEHGEGLTWLLRIDAHAHYPDRYADILLDEARTSGADSVVVAMKAVGTSLMQHVVALAQNSRLGNGGAAHRTGVSGRFVEHGHHALMRVSAFEGVGGYDESFSHNEDAELDLRLGRAGHRIWLTTRTGLEYLPRRDLPALMRQYFRFGAGRARTTLKHRLRPKLRQAVLIALAPLLLLALLGPFQPVLALPLILWVLGCALGGGALALKHREIAALAAGPIAGCMHLAWSAGFWAQALRGAPQGSEPPVTGLKPSEASVPPGRVAVGICTFRRAELTEALRTLEAQELPDGVRLCVIVSDNDSEPSAQETVESFARTSRHEVVYRHAPAGNISIARNAVLEETARRGLDRLAFIDDDELAPPYWLARLLGQLARDEADAVVGPVRALYGPEAPDWMRTARVHDTRPELGPDGRPIAGHSCNVILRTCAPAFAEQRFDLDRGISGGEDTGYFEAARRAGAKLSLAPGAWLEEPVPASRARLGWLLRRRYRMGQTHGSLLREGRENTATALPLALAKVAYCAAAMLLTAPAPVWRNANLLRGALHAGTVSGLLGRSAVAIYGEGLSGVGTVSRR